MAFVEGTTIMYLWHTTVFFVFYPNEEKNNKKKKHTSLQYSKLHSKLTLN